MRFSDMMRAASEVMQKPTPQQQLRLHGYEDNFFQVAASWGLKVIKVTLGQENFRITFQGVNGNSFSHTTIFPRLTNPDNPEPIDPLVEMSALSLLEVVHGKIVRGNPAIKNMRPVGRGAAGQHLTC